MESFLEHIDIQEDGTVRYNDLLIKPYGTDEDYDKELANWGSRLPFSVDRNNLECYGSPRSYGVRPSLYKTAFVSAGIVNGNLVGAAGLCGKRINYYGKVYRVLYGIDGIIHPDYRSKGYVNLISLRNSYCAVQGGIYDGTYGSVTASNIPSIRSCEKGGMSRLFAYDRLITNLSQCNFYAGQDVPTAGIRVHRDPVNTARLLKKYFSSSNFFPVDSIEITTNRPFLGTMTFNEDSDSFAMASIWDMGYVNALHGTDGQSKKAYFLFGGCGDLDLLTELIRRTCAWARDQSSKDTYVVINTNSSDDVMAQAFYKAFPASAIKGIPYLYYLRDNTKEKNMLSAGRKQDSYPLKQIGEGVENLFADPPQDEIPHTFFDPRDNGILLVPRRSIIEHPQDFVTSSLISSEIVFPSKI